MHDSTQLLTEAKCMAIDLAEMRWRVMPGVTAIFGGIMKSRLIAVVLLSAGAAMASGQTQNPHTGASGLETLTPENLWSTNLGNEPLGPGDLIYVSVAGAPEMSRSFRVDSEGAITLPVGEGVVAVSGLRPGEAASAVKAKLEGGKILVSPIVSVSVLDYRSRQVTVVGAVKQPGQVQALGDLSVLSAIAKAQGLAPEAGSDVIVTRHVNGVETQTRIALKELIDGANADQNILLRGGDEVRVPDAAKIFIVGNIKMPGTYSLVDSSGTTVLKALAMSQGELAFSEKTAYVYRTSGGKRNEIQVPLRKILNRKAPDMALLANDILYVPERRGLHLTANVLDRVTGIGGSVASRVVLY